MRALELGRRAFARIRAERNGHTAAAVDVPLSRSHRCAERAGSAVRPPSPAAAPAARGGTAGAVSEKSAESPPYLLVTDAGDLAAVEAAVEESVAVGLDCETTGLDPRRDRARLLQLAPDSCAGT